MGHWIPTSVFLWINIALPLKHTPISLVKTYGRTWQTHMVSWAMLIQKVKKKKKDGFQ
jgi:hypothetical protein